ncbi:hypothetical protein MIND_01264000 [Mycena indigotica]|uniref:Uncharacterized protein n=1 Tax=Mycena indigotica TaxID=2126181 RepID=A0A8H6S366_9AGAR|nr:uncharacterized protein MIND_01264000 [Mycena indigotica]KAF7291206.1 hypothetical protein MIND_01264000 [Mycena indigotica]
MHPPPVFERAAAGMCNGVISDVAHDSPPSLIAFFLNFFCACFSSRDPLRSPASSSTSTDTLYAFRPKPCPEAMLDGRKMTTTVTLFGTVYDDEVGGQACSAEETSATGRRRRRRQEGKLHDTGSRQAHLSIDCR